MTVRPDNRHCIVALLLNTSGVHFWVDFLLLDEHASTQLVDASGTLAAKPQRVGVYLLGGLLLLDHNCPLVGVIVHIYLQSWFLQLLSDC